MSRILVPIMVLVAFYLLGHFVPIEVKTQQGACESDVKIYRAANGQLSAYHQQSAKEATCANPAQGRFPQTYKLYLW